MNKIDFATASRIKKMNQKELTIFCNQVFNDGIEVGYNKCMQDEDRFDWWMIEVAILSTHGVGKKTLEKIKDNCYKLLSEVAEHELK